MPFPMASAIRLEVGLVHSTRVALAVPGSREHDLKDAYFNVLGMTHEDMEVEAYFIYLDRLLSGEDGTADGDWYEAERRAYHRHVVIHGH